MAEQALVLASASPRRRHLLRQLAIPFEIVPAELDETPEPGEEPVDHVRRLAEAKASAVASRVEPGQVVLAADTTVELAGSIVGKPTDEADARVVLRALSGRTHQVHTAVVVTIAGPDPADSPGSALVTTSVTFRDLSADEIAAYVATGEPLDKAGAYGIQGKGAALVARVEGSVSNVVGLPMAQTAALLADAGLPAVRWGPPR